jgi:Putative beta-barrel porin 2
VDVAAVALAAVAMVVVGSPVRAQQPGPDPPYDARLRAGPLTVAPVIRLWNAGHDTNVFNRDRGQDPIGDTTLTASPSVQVWLRSRLFRVTGYAQADLYYYKDLPDLRAPDTASGVRVDVRLNRLLPYVNASFSNMRHQENLEIDALARRRNDTVTAGVDLRLGAKFSAGPYVLWSRLKYDQNSLFLNSDLARVLNYNTTGEGVGARYAATPFTTFGAQVERQRDRFTSSGDRDSDNVLVIPFVEFNPRALVSGRASFGFQTRKFLTPGSQDSTATVALVDLSYTLRTRTRFTVAASRQLEYSYFIGRMDYVEGAVTLTVTRRLGDSWDVGGSLGPARLSYLESNTPATAGTPPFPDESILTSDADLGYTIGRTRAGFHFEYRSRQTDVPLLARGYERFRFGATLTYRF